MVGVNDLEQLSCRYPGLDNFLLLVFFFGFFLFFKIILFSYLLLAVLGLRCCVGFASAAVSRGRSPAVLRRLPLQWLLWFRNTDARPTVVAGFTSRSSQASLPAGVWDLSRPGTPCPLHWLVDSQPLDCQRSPV